MPRDVVETPAAPGTWHLEQGDCVEVMRRWAEEGVQVDAIVCDPPFHLMSVVKRFGKMTADTKGVVAERTRARTDGAARLASGMMGMLWDGNEEGKLPIAFDPETWIAAIHPKARWATLRVWWDQNQPQNGLRHRRRRL